MRLFVRKQVCVPSWQGWLVLAAAFCVLIGVAAFSAYPFLASTQRVPTDVLVVEGWVHPYAIEAAVAEFKKGGYRLVVTTGGPPEGYNYFVNDHSTSAGIAASRLRNAGLAPTAIGMAPAHTVSRDRTYASALALGTWLAAQAPDVRAINVLTADAHARRTRLLFQQALGPKYAVGVIAVPSPDYDADHWWRYSEGVRTVLGEALSYVYAKLLFIPGSHLDPNPSNPHLHEHYVESSH